MTQSLLAGVFALAALPILAPAAEPPAKLSPWFTDYPAARAEARKTDKPLLVVFR
jgi:hypothetical protein